MAIFFISDLHFGRTNILRARSQFKSISDMDEYLIINGMKRSMMTMRFIFLVILRIKMQNISLIISAD